MRAVGLALDQWSHVEMGLEDLFCNSLGIQEGPAHVVMSSIRSFHARLAVIQNLIAYLVIEPDLRARWTSLYNRLTRKNDKRNELAHFSILDATANGKREIRLKPYFSTGAELLEGTRKPLGPVPPGLSFEQIEERAASFSKLALDVWMFSREMREFLALRKAALEQARGQARQPDTPSVPNPKEPPTPPQP